jgi:hypothetical protein
MPKNDELRQALEAAADYVADHPEELEPGPRGAVSVPPWLTTILQLIGPPVLSAVRAWIDAQIGPETPAVPKA